MTIRKISTETHLRGRLSDLGINQRPLQRGRPLIHLIQRMNGQERRPPVHLIPRINRQEEAVAIPSILNRIANERIVEMRARVAARRPLTNERIMALREFAALREDIDGQIIELRELRERNETINERIRELGETEMPLSRKILRVGVLTMDTMVVGSVIALLIKILFILNAATATGPIILSLVFLYALLSIIAGIVSAHAVGLIADMYLGFRY